MADQTTTNPAPGGNAEGLRDVPTDIDEYRKFVNDGGLDHNAKVLGREAAEKAAKDAGIIPADKTAAAGEPHKQNGFQQRVTRLQRKIGERDQRIKDLEARIATGSGPAPAANGSQPAAARPAAAADKQPVNGKAPEDKTPPKPKEADFKTYGEFIEALDDWKIDRKFEARDAKRAEERRAQTDADKGKEISDAHTARVKEAKERYSDWDEAFKGLSDADFSDPILVFVFESDVGPDVTYYLVTHREDLARIRKLTPIRQAAELGKIEDKILAARPKKDEDEDTDKGDDKGRDKGAPKKPKEPEDEDDEDETPPKRAAKPAAAASKAPPPEKPIGGRAGAGDEMPDPSDFVAYEAWSKRQKAKGKK